MVAIYPSMTQGSANGEGVAGEQYQHESDEPSDELADLMSPLSPAGDCLPVHVFRYEPLETVAKDFEKIFQPECRPQPV